jgi:hypothetical protein
MRLYYRAKCDTHDWEGQSRDASREAEADLEAHKMLYPDEPHSGAEVIETENLGRSAAMSEDFDELNSCGGNACADVRSRTIGYSPLKIELKMVGSRDATVRVQWINPLGAGMFTDVAVWAGAPITVTAPHTAYTGYNIPRANFTSKEVDAEIPLMIEQREEIERFRTELGDGLVTFSEDGAPNGNQVQFWFQGNIATLLLSNMTEYKQTTNYLITVLDGDDNRWQVHTQGFATVDPRSSFQQDFHQWRAADWRAQWW